MSHDHDREGARQPHRFDPARADRLDDPARLAWVPPAALERLLDLPRGGTLIDFGTGTGTYALLLAQARPDARVVALDEQAPLLERVRAKLAAAPQPNLEPILSGTLAASGLLGRADRVLALNVLHELGDAALEELRQLLRAGGRLVVVDWNALVERPGGPPAAHCYAPAVARARLEQAGLRVLAEEAFPYHFALVCAAS